ncbi:hypothetical protein [Jannaschia sp. 2305UL9-9]
MAGLLRVPVAAPVAGLTRLLVYERKIAIERCRIAALLSVVSRPE